jgi:hypothetical protein
LILPPELLNKTPKARTNRLDHNNQNEKKGKKKNTLKCFLIAAFYCAFSMNRFAHDEIFWAFDCVDFNSS